MSHSMSVSVSGLFEFRCKTPSTLIQIFLKPEIFLFVLALRPHVNGVFGNRKGRFLKMLSGVEFFKNAVFAFTSGRAKTGVLEFHDVDDQM